MNTLKTPELCALKMTKYMICELDLIKLLEKTDKNKKIRLWAGRGLWSRWQTPVLDPKLCESGVFVSCHCLAHSGVKGMFKPMSSRAKIKEAPGETRSSWLVQPRGGKERVS